jgi:hypothetical protein
MAQVSSQSGEKGMQVCPIYAVFLQYCPETHDKIEKGKKTQTKKGKSKTRDRTNKRKKTKEGGIGGGRKKERGREKPKRS